MIMKKTVSVEQTFCDDCQKDARGYGPPCDHCKKDLCWDCAVTRSKVGCSGSSDGHWCRTCDAKLLVSREDELHNAYVEAQRMKDEYVGTHERWRERRDVLDERIDLLRKKMGLR